jgi:hypothetical protein
VNALDATGSAHSSQADDDMNDLSEDIFSDIDDFTKLSVQARKYSILSEVQHSEREMKAPRKMTCITAQSRQKKSKITKF